MAYYGSYKSPYQTPFSAFPDEEDLYATYPQEAAQQQAGGGLAGTVGGLAGMYGASQLLGPASAAPAAAGAVGAPEILSLTRTGAAAPVEGSLGGFLLPAAGVLGMGDVLLNDRGTGRGALQGAASGAAIGSYFGMPLVGAGIGGVIGLGKGLLKGKPKTNVEQDRWKALGALGYAVPDGYDDPGRKPFAGVDKTQAADFVGNTADSGKWVNNKFAASRDEKDLVGKDLIGYATFGEKFGKDWMNNYSLDQKEKIAQKALDLGAVDEHHGTIDVKWNPEIEAYAKEVLTPPKKEEQKRRR